MAQKGGAVVTVLFGLIFLGVGVGAGYFSLRTLARAEAARRWTETPAQVLSCELAVSRGSKGGSTYQAKATYRYEAGGASRTGSRVSLQSGSDNIGGFQRRAYAELKRCLEQKQPTVCWVNPADPAEAVLYPKPRLEMLIFLQLFVFAFGGVGLPLVLAGAEGLFQPSAQAAPSAAAGQGQIRMLGAASHRVAGALALAWNGYAGWFLWQAFHVLSPEPLPWWLWLMAATGVIPAAAAGYLIGRFRKFGISVFEMSPLPGVLGGPVSGTIRIPAKVETEDGFDVELQCIRQYTTGSGKQRSTHRDVLWQDSRHIAGGLSYGDETMLQVRFAVPYGEQATTASGGCNGIYWRLNATAAAPGIDYKAVFDVPVKRTPQSAPAAVPQLGLAPMPSAGLEPVAEVVGREGLKLAPQAGGGFELVFPAARALASSLFLALFFAGWTAACAALWTVAKAPLPFAAVFTFFDAVVLLALLDALFASRGIVVDRSRRECAVWYRLAGFPRRERRIPFDAVIDIRSERAGQSGNTVYYRIVLATEGGTPRTVGSGIRLWNDAEDIAKLLRAAIEPSFTLEGFRV
jgi:hypothetical protein